MRGQAEVIIIVGVLAVVVVAVYYTFLGGSLFPDSTPKGILAEQRLVADNVKNIIRDATDRTMRTMMIHGGYLDDPSIAGTTWRDVPNVDFMLSGVAYWQRCSSSMYPSLEDIESWMEASIEKAVKEGIEDVEGTEAYRNVEFDTGSIDAQVDIKGVSGSFLEGDEVAVKLSMPTRVRDYPMSSSLYPYAVSIDSEFGRIYAFGKDFSDASTTERYFDVFTIAAIYFSKSPEDHPELPTFGMLTRCGEVLYRSPAQINAYLTGVVEYVLSSIMWWQPMYDQSIYASTWPDQTESKIPAIQDLNGKTYGDLEVSALMADGFSFNLNDYVFTTNFIMPRRDQFIIPICTAEYNHGYDFNYPLIIRVKDDYTGYSFNLASEVSVKEVGEVMEPGECGQPSVAGEDPCGSASCHGSVTVKDDLGVPLEGAMVAFGGCPMGETDSAGVAEGDVLCGQKDLFVYQDDEHEFLKESVPSSALAQGYDVALHPVSPVEVHFWEVNISQDGLEPVFYDDEVHYEQVTCDACSRSCPFTTLLKQTCTIITISREYAYSMFQRSESQYPVTNVDIDNPPAGCGESQECQSCNEVTREAEELYGDNQQAIGDYITQHDNGACSTCALSCTGSPVNSADMDYLPLGYQYSIDASMYDPQNDLNIVGGFGSTPFEVKRDEEDINVFIPRRASDRTGFQDFDMGDAEKDCLVQAMGRCGIEPVSEEVPEKSTIISVQPDQGNCGFLKSLAQSCGGSVPSNLYCECAEGSGYPGGCGGSCGGMFEPQCSTCCDLSGLVSFANSVCNGFEIILQ